MSLFQRLSVSAKYSRFVFILGLMYINGAIAAEFKQLVIFGDSLSDTGNHPAAILGTPPPYYENRISNGPVAVDVLASHLGLSAAHSGYIFGNGTGLNYAVSGANAAGSELHDLVAQFNAFTNRQLFLPHAQMLYLMMIGGNDVRDAAVINDVSVGQTKIAAAVNAILAVMEQLLEDGVKTLLISNVPDISRIPETSEREISHPGIKSRARALSVLFNQLLTQQVASLTSKFSANILVFDFYQNFNLLLDSPGSNGFSNTTEACFYPSTLSFHPQCGFEQFVFFDSIHPTAKTHALIGEALVDLIQSSGAGIPVVVPAIQLLLFD